MIAGLQPNPDRKYPIPTIFGESAKHIAKTPKVHIPHAILTAILRPQLSAIYGIAKNPDNEPINNIDCKTLII